MNRLPTTIRESLLLDAKKFSQVQSIPWSIQSLANLNENSIADNATSLTVNGIEQSSAQIKASYTNTFMNKQSIVQRNVAEQLLGDVKLRLAGQHSKCLTLMDQIRQRYGREHEWSTKKPVFGSNNNMLLSENTGRPRIIKALNQPVRNINYLKFAKNLQSNLKKIMRSLENIESLHSDTYLISYQLLANDGPAFKRFTKADQNLIASTFEQIRSRHASSVETLADVVIGLRECDYLSNISDNRKQDNQIEDEFLPHERSIDHFLRARLGVQLLCDHYMALHKCKPTGVISLDCNFAEVLEAAVTEAKVICTQNMLTAPDVDISFESNTGGEMTIIRPWMHHVLVEILKNAMASSVQRTLNEKLLFENSPPPILIKVMEKKYYYDCLICDNGVGLTEESMERAFRFAETSSLRRWDRMENQQSYAAPQTVPLGGLGVGIPLSAMMMQMFGGNLFLANRSTTLKEEKKSEENDSETGCIVTLRIMKDQSIEQKLY